MALLLKDPLPAPKPRFSQRHRLTAPGALEYTLAACGLVAAGLILFDVGGLPLAVFKLAICLVLPGWALSRRLRGAEPAARLVLTLAASVVTYSIFALAMAWLQLWNPRPVAAAVLVAAAFYVLTAPGQRLAMNFSGLRRPTFRESVPWVTLAAAMVTWGVALILTSDEQLGSFGLLPVFPIMWYVAAAVVLGLCIRGIAARTVSSHRFLSTSVAGLVLILYSSASLLAEVPRLPWTYKHIAVTDLIGATGQIDSMIDIYNRWPGFFALSAFLGEVIGYRNALSYAALAETGFALISVVLVLAIARTLSRNPRIYWTAALVFALANWVNQNYYSPQAFAFTLHLTMCLIILTYLRGTPAAWVIALEGRLTRWGKRTSPRSPKQIQSSGRAVPSWAIVAVLALQIVIVASHQLTPYLAISGLFPLLIVGYFRPKWLAPALLVIALLYVLPHLDFIDGKYGFGGGFDFFSNIGYKKLGADPGEWLLTGRWVAREALALSVLTGLLGVAGFVRRLLQGKVRTALIVGLLATAPILGMFGTSYGGEARLRVYLFALPWLAIGVAWLFWSGPIRTRATAIGATATLSMMAVLFTGVYFQPEASVRVSSQDVAASTFLDARIQARDLIVETNYHLPLLIGPNYPNYLDSGRVTSIARMLKNSTVAVTVQDVIARADKVRESNHVRPWERIYVVISDHEQYTVTANHKPVPPEAISQLEHELAMSNEVMRVFDSQSIRIYQITRIG